jgi:hypothetical protein
MYSTKSVDGFPAIQYRQPEPFLTEGGDQRWLEPMDSAFKTKVNYA